ASLERAQPIWIEEDSAHPPRSPGSAIPHASAGYESGAQFGRQCSPRPRNPSLILLAGWSFRRDSDTFRPYRLREARRGFGESSPGCTTGGLCGGPLIPSWLTFLAWRPYMNCLNSGPAGHKVHRPKETTFAGFWQE